MTKKYYYLRLLWVKLMHAGAYSGCHQLSERSFFFRQYQFPVCARCTGAIIGQVIAIALWLSKNTTSFWVYLSFALIMLVDWSIQFIGLRHSNNARRLITGILGGFGCWSLLLQCVTYVLKL